MSLHTASSKAASVAALMGLTLVRGESSCEHARDASVPAGVDTRDSDISSASLEVPKATSAPGSSSCPTGMVLVDGESCPEPEQVCLRWLDPPPYQNLRCAEYQKPAKCKGARVHRRFCIDRDEFPENERPDALPMVNKSWTEAKAVCESRGARLCKENEWEFACEGTEMRPYPYGFSREPGACNVDRTDLGGAGDKLIDHRAPPSSFEQCTSPFGVHHMTGNVDEWAEREGVAAPARSALRGGWWLPGRNRCRAATLHHGESYSAKQVGFRCCSDAR